MMTKKKYTNTLFSKTKTWFFMLIFFVYSISFQGQCAMCRASLTSQANAEKAQAVNDGIVYLMIIPYVLVGVIFYWIYKTRKNIKKLI